MRTDWRECQIGYKRSLRWATLYVTINYKGEIMFSRPTFEKMGEPKAVSLLFDLVNNRIGLKPTVPGMRNAVHVGIRGKFGGRVVRACPLLAEFKLSFPDTLRFYDAEIDDDGILILDLRTARVPPTVTSRKARGRRETGQ